jgi:hypothetical protein
MLTDKEKALARKARYFGIEAWGVHKNGRYRL